MKRAQNRSDDGNTDQSLPRSKILRGRRNFQRLFEKSTVLTSDSIQFRYRLYDDPSEGCYIGFIAPKKIVKSAVQRNRTKRLMREVYRFHQHFFLDLFSKKTFGFHGAFTARQAGLTNKQAKEEMIPILQAVRERLLNIVKEPSDISNTVGSKSNNRTK